MYNSSLAPSIIKTAIDMVFEGEFGYHNIPGLATAEDGSVFMQDSTDRAAVITEQIMGPGYFETKAEMQDVQSGTARVGNQKAFSVVEFAKSIDISKNLMDDDQHSTIDVLVRRFARNARLTKDKEAFKIYNLGFTTTLTNDGSALFADSHTTLDGSTVDNKLTDALAETSLDTAIQAMIQQKTQDSTLGGHIPSILLVPPALFKKANEIAKSELRSGTANNDLNYYSQIFPGLQVRQSPFLSTAFGGSDTAWFLLSQDHSVKRWVRQGLITDLVDYKNQRNNNFIYKASYREVTGPISFEGVIGSDGTV